MFIFWYIGIFSIAISQALWLWLLSLWRFAKQDSSGKMSLKWVKPNQNKIPIGGWHPRSATTRLYLPMQQHLSSVHFYLLGYGSVLCNLYRSKLVSVEDYHKEHLNFLNLYTFLSCLRQSGGTPILDWSTVAAYGSYAISFLCVFKTSQKTCFKMFGFWNGDINLAFVISYKLSV